MPEAPAPLLNNRRSRSIRSLKFDKADLRKLSNQLQAASNKAAQFEVDKLSQNSFKDDDSFELAKGQIREAAILSITVKGVDDQEIFGDIETVFDTVEFPGNLTMFLVDSSLKFNSRYNFRPRNRFSIYLSCERSRIFNLSFSPTLSTFNESNFEVNGEDDIWVSGVSAKIEKFLSNKKTKYATIHAEGTYDLLLYMLAFPFAFYICNKASSLIDTAFSNSIASGALYVYVFALTLFCFRILFQYLRWLNPIVEFRTRKSTQIFHKSIISFILISILLPVTIDLLPPLWNTVFK